MIGAPLLRLPGR